MTQITLGSEPVNTVGSLPEKGQVADPFQLVGEDLSLINSDDYAGRRIILNIFPSVDTGVCAMSVRQFNKIASELENTTVICVSKDLPFAFERFCGAEGIDKVVTGSAFRSSFGEDYGVTMADGPLQGLLSRAVVIIDEDGLVKYTQQVPEIKEEPNYDDVMEALELG